MMCMQNLCLPNHAKRVRQESVWATVRSAHSRPHEKRGLLKQSVPSRLRTHPRRGAEPRGSHPSALHRGDTALFSPYLFAALGTRDTPLSRGVHQDTQNRCQSERDRSIRSQFDRSQIGRMAWVASALPLSSRQLHPCLSVHRFSVSIGDLREEGRISRVPAKEGVWRRKM